jgi:hypothetical protein
VQLRIAMHANVYVRHTIIYRAFESVYVWTHGNPDTQHEPFVEVNTLELKRGGVIEHLRVARDVDERSLLSITYRMSSDSFTKFKEFAKLTSHFLGQIDKNRRL